MENTESTVGNHRGTKARRRDGQSEEEISARFGSNVNYRDAKGIFRFTTEYTGNTEGNHRGTEKNNKGDSGRKREGTKNDSQRLPAYLPRRIQLRACNRYPSL